MAGFEVQDGAKFDGLFGGTGEPVRTRNVKVADDAEIKRGAILAGTEGGVFALATASDTDKILTVAAEDFAANATANVTTVYTSGEFNREKLTVADGADIAAFEEPLRKANIILTSIKEAH